MTLDKKLLDVSINPQLIKDYLVALRKNARQWSANTKGRSEIAQSNAKPHPQKGTGKQDKGVLKLLSTEVVQLYLVLNQNLTNMYALTAKKEELPFTTSSHRKH